MTTTATDPDLRTLARAVDTELAKKTGDLARERAHQGDAVDTLHRELGSKATGPRGRRSWNRTAQEVLELALSADTLDLSNRELRNISGAVARYDLTQLAIDELIGRIFELHAVYGEHGGWSRFFIVAGGHIHSTMNCSTCNNGRNPTQFGWLPELSALTEADAVAEHGARLCTVCFPSAPVEWTNFYEAQAAAKKAAQCPGSGTWDYPRETARMGYCAGNYGVCKHCGERVTLTTTHKLRGHKAA